MGWRFKAMETRLVIQGAQLKFRYFKLQSLKIYMVSYDLLRNVHFCTLTTGTFLFNRIRS